MQHTRRYPGGDAVLDENTERAKNPGIVARLLEGDAEMESVFVKVLEPQIQVKVDAARDDGRREGAAGAFRTMAERMINAGKPGNEIRLFTNLGRQEIDVIAARMNRTVSWSEASV